MTKWEPLIEHHYKDGVLIKSTIQRTFNGPKEDYTDAPTRVWVGLTDEEIFEALQQVDALAVRLPPAFKLLARQLEARLKEKNT